ncbi:MAG: PAS domain S-box protein [Gemmatimonadetes bacterium]|nr:PAS domain S-box protein [Gemmatimonadota bacterium]
MQDGSSQTEGRYLHVLENVRAIIVETDDQGRFTYVSPTITEVLGYAPAELLNRRGLQTIHEEDRAAVAELFQKLLSSGQGTKLVHRARHKNGRWVWLETALNSYRAADGSTYTVALARDITDVKLAEESLRESEARYGTLAANASDLIAEVDEDGRFLFISPNCFTVLGYRAEDLVGGTVPESPIIENVHPDDREKLIAAFARNIGSGGTGGQIEFRYRHGDGRWLWFESKAKTYRTSGGALRAVVISRDISERVQSHQELKQSEERYRVLAETTRDLITEMDMDGRLVYASRTCEELFGYTPEEMVGSTPFGLVHPDDVGRAVQTFQEAIEKQTLARMDSYRVRCRDGSWRWVEGAGITYRRTDGTLSFLSVTRDITERRRAEQERRELEERVQQAQRLESLGVMAGGIAHDFNNLLTPILGEASLALLDLPADSPARARLQLIQKAAHRAAALTNQMLNYAGKGWLEPAQLDLSRIVREMGQLLQSVVSKEVALVFELAEDLPEINADAAQLGQVVMNLIMNASEAMGDSGGQLTVRTGTVDATRGYLDQNSPGNDLPEGRYVYFEVLDGGCGMDAETRLRIFDPFFTTKFQGRGLGLAAVLGIVRGHGGTIDVESEAGRGTRFRVLFPGSDRSRAHGPAEPVATEEWRGSETVLVVDDDAGVREYAQEILERSGLSVICAADGREAIEFFQRHSEEISAVLLDQSMPGMSGDDALDEILKIRPNVPILLVSGYSEKRVSELFAGRRLAGAIQKPFLPTTLIEKVRQALED